MSIFNKKNTTLLLAFIASLVPSRANNTRDPEKEVPIPSYKIFIEYTHEGKGKFGFKCGLPINHSTVLHCNISANGIGSITPIYSVTKPSNRSEEIKYIFMDKISDKENFYAWFKETVKELYIEQKDDTGSQSRSFGIIKNVYDATQTIGVAFETYKLKVCIDIEGMLRSLSSESSESSNKNNSSGLGAFVLNWKDVSNFIVEASFAMKLSKGDFTSLGINNSSNLFKYLESAYIEFEVDEPILDVFRKFKLKYTHLKDSTDESGELHIIPQLSLDIECEEIEIFGEAADKVILGFSYFFCDMTHKHYNKPDDSDTGPFHLSMSLGLTFKNIFDQNNLTVSPTMKVFWAPKNKWHINDDYLTFLWDLSFKVKKEVDLSEYYSF